MYVTSDVRSLVDNVYLKHEKLTTTKAILRLACSSNPITLFIRP